MPKLTKETVERLSQLSRIHCSEEVLDSLLQDLDKIFEYFELLKEVDTEDVPPCNHVLEGMVNVMREDETSDTIPRKEFLDNSPSHTGGLIRVPPVIHN